MLCLSGFELYSRWVPLSIQCGPSCPLHSLHSKETVYLNSVRVVVSGFNLGFFNIQKLCLRFVLFTEANRLHLDVFVVSGIKSKHVITLDV